MLYLPPELTNQILLMLSVKDLTRFKSVCKSWFSLISNPHFAKSHFDLAAAPTHRILCISTSVHETKSIDLEASFRDNSSSVSLNRNFKLPESDFNVEIKDSCRGFIFLHSPSSNYIWNPSTGVHKQIPLSPFEFDLDPKCYCYLYGFGYDNSKDDYLVVSMSYDPLADIISSHLEFFSLKANKWKEIEGDFPYMNVYHDPKVGLFFNEAIHWFACLTCPEDLIMDVIVVFDLVERKLIEMPMPDGFMHEAKDCDFWVFGGFLSIWAKKHDSIEIWVMKEYKVHSSWTKTLVLSIDDGAPTQYFSPKCCTKNGYIIGTYDGTHLMKCSDKGQMLEYISYDHPHGSQVAMYTESLLSPLVTTSKLKRMTRTRRMRM